MSLLALMLLLLCPAPADEVVVREGLGQRADTWVSRMVPLGFSGTVLLAKDGEVLLAKAYGEADRTRGVPARIDTLWPLGSISKHFTAAAILKLQMEGELSVFDRLDELFDDVPADKGAITLHHLLTHQSGLPEASGAGDRAATAEEKLAHAWRTGLVFPPGMGAGYSNLGYNVLAAVVERVAGKPFEEYLREHVLQPAGMTDTAMSLGGWDDERVARGMIDGVDRGRLDDDFEGRPPWFLYGAGGLQSTVWDMYRWSEGLRAHTVLDQDTLAAMTTPHVQRGPGSGTGYGCGVSATPRGGTMIGHNGSDDVFMADWRLYFEDGVTLFTASNHADVYCEIVSDAVLRMTFGGDVPLPPEVVPLPDEALAAYAGTWTAPEGGTLTLDPRGTGLLLSSPDASGARLVHPVPGFQQERREGLLRSTRSAFLQAAKRDFASLHGLIDPYAPADEFEADHGDMLDHWAGQLGPLEDVTTVPGRNRFGEIAVVAVLHFARGEQMIEYSFGDREVGSIRLLRELPARQIQPLSPIEFVAFDAETGERFQVEFELDGEGTPVGLRLGGVTAARD
jgi:CubicO group peptidase (beta-lactamase class C family)